MINKKRLLIYVIAINVLQNLSAVAPVNFIRPYDANLDARHWQDQKIKILNLGTYGFDGDGWNGDGDKVNVAEYLNADQNALAAFKGFATGTAQNDIIQDNNLSGADDGIRGHLKVKADFKVSWSYQLAARYFIGNDWWVGAFIPFYKTKLKDVTWTDQTKAITAEDDDVKTNITNDLFTNIATHGQGLSLQGWSKVGPGDLVLMGGWQHDFVQYKPWIKGVKGHIQVGMAFPTGVKKDEDKIMSMPFGNDGSTGLLVGAGLDINFKHRVNAGIAVDFMHVFNNTRDRRIKLHADQTEFLLLKKTPVHKDHGFTQRFVLFCEPQLFKGISLRFSYQHIRRGNDTLYVVSNDYSSTIANTTEAAKEWTTHTFFSQLKWDFATDENNKEKAQLNLFYQHPFNGRRSVQNRSFGCGIVINF